MFNTPIIPLNNGNEIPLLGLGTYGLKDGFEGEEAIEYGLMLGYRHLDTAAAYENEKLVGKMVAESGIPRNELFLTSKIQLSDYGRGTTQDALKRSLDNLQTDHLDLCLLHWPNEDTMLDAWQDLCEAQRDGLCKSIGVSNFTIDRFKRFPVFLEDPVPAINQVECHVFWYQQALLEYCRGRHILVEAHTPMARGQFMTHQLIDDMVERHERTPAQIMLRWLMQHGIPAIPKSCKHARIRENLDVFDFHLSGSEMMLLDGVGMEQEVCTWRPDPDNWY